MNPQNGRQDEAVWSSEWHSRERSESPSPGHAERPAGSVPGGETPQPPDGGQAPGTSRRGAPTWVSRCITKADGSRRSCRQMAVQVFGVVRRDSLRPPEVARVTFPSRPIRSLSQMVVMARASMIDDQPPDGSRWGLELQARPICMHLVSIRHLSEHHVLPSCSPISLLELYSSGQGHVGLRYFRWLLRPRSPSPAIIISSSSSFCRSR